MYHGIKAITDLGLEILANMSVLLQNLLLVRREFCVFVKDKVLCSCGEKFVHMSDVENHVVNKHEKIMDNSDDDTEDAIDHFLKNLKDKVDLLIPPKTFLICLNENDIKGGTLRSIKCPECAEHVDCFQSLYSHYRELHPGKFSSDANSDFILRSSHDVEKQFITGWNSQYFCPIPKCKYHILEPKRIHHKNLKSLRQHYTKVHACKSHQCQNCDKSFQNEAILNRHQNTCGVDFKCESCDKHYPSFETLQTHCRRKGHTPCRADHIRKKRPEKAICPTLGPDGLVKIAPKPSLWHLNAAIALSELSSEIKFWPKVDVGNQTDLNLLQPLKAPSKKSSTITTQTQVSSLPNVRKRTAETQTRRNKKRKAPSNIKEVKNEIEVFPTLSDSKSKSSFSPLLVCDKPLWSASNPQADSSSNLIDTGEVMKSKQFSIETQTDLLNNPSKSCGNLNIIDEDTEPFASIETQTEFASWMSKKQNSIDILNDIEHFSIETQTDVDSSSWIACKQNSLDMMPEIAQQFSIETQTDVDRHSWFNKSYSNNSSLDNEGETFTSNTFMEAETQFDLDDILCSNFTQTGELDPVLVSSDDNLVSATPDQDPKASEMSGNPKIQNHIETQTWDENY